MEIGVVKPVIIEEEMKSSYLDYAMSVIVSRALPDVRDGLKPVQRRILYAMHELGLRHSVSHKKSARIVGEVLGKYHPHGDVSVYEAMVRMAQDFSMRYVLVDGQGNFGSVDNDPPAAMRYTEARLAQIAEEMLVDIDKGTVDFAPNFDGSLQEPQVLPARLPNLLLNGATGIAVGMATNIPPHNLGEICDAISCLIDNPECSIDELVDLVKGPDFPTAGIILGVEGIRDAYITGHGRIVVRAKAIISDTAGSRPQIVVTELPYQINKAALVERIAELVRQKKLEGIADLRDESDRQGMRIVIELRKEAQPQQVLNNLYKYTAMQSAFAVNMLALVDGQPRVLSLKEMLQYYVEFRHQVIVRRSQFELERAKERAHILEGLRVALDNLDKVIETIRRSASAEAARTALMERFGLTQIQAQAILDMQLRRLAALERQKILDEYTEVLRNIAYLEDLLANPRKILFLIKQDVAELKNSYGDPRRTQISVQGVLQFGEEDLIAHQEVVVTISNRGYIKRVSVDAFRSQRRGGRGMLGMSTREEDGTRDLRIADTHDHLLFFTNRGWVFRLKCHELPGDSSRTSRGTPLINLVSLQQQDQVTAVVTARNLGGGDYIVLATARGEVKKTSLDEFAVVRSNGLIAMDLEPGDELVAAVLVGNEEDVMLVTERGKSIRFVVKQLRSASRTSGGVRGIKLSPGDRVVDMVRCSAGEHLLVVSANGFGKVTSIGAYPRHGRGGGGLITFKVNDKTGVLAAALMVHLDQEVMLLSAEGIVIRIAVKDVAIRGRSTQGVGLMKVAAGDNRVVSVACLDGRPHVSALGS